MSISARRLNFQKDTGFTLVELMVVISIIALLSAIGLTIFSQAQIAARDAKRISDMQETQKALEQYYAINQSYPLGTGGNVSAIPFGSATYFQNTSPPSDPNVALVGNVQYRYWSCGATGTAYNICARLENCSGRCNHDSTAPSGCDQVGAPGSSTAAGSLFCLRAISN